MDPFPVERISALAGLELEGREERTLKRDLEGMIQAFRVLEEVDVQRVEPMQHPFAPAYSPGIDVPEGKGLDKEWLRGMVALDSRGRVLFPPVLPDAGTRGELA